MRYDSTNWHKSDNGNINYLTYHNVECKTNEVLSYWGMSKNGDNVRISYYCVSFLSISKKYNWKYTRWNGIASDRWKSVNHLDRHTLICDSDESMGAFNMERSGNYIRFKYRCNKTTNSYNRSKLGAWFDCDRGQMYYLYRMGVIAPMKHDGLNVLRGWGISTSYYKKWFTSYQKLRFNIYYNTLRNYNDHL